MGEIIDIDLYNFKEKDVVLWGSIEKAKNEALGNSGSEGDFIKNRWDVIQASCCELTNLENDIATESVKKEDNNINIEDEELKTVEKTSKNIVEWKYAKNWYIEFFINWEALEFNPKNTQENGVWFFSEFAELKEITILTDHWNFVVKDGFIYDWDKSIGFYKGKIGTYMWKSNFYSKYWNIFTTSNNNNSNSLTLKNYQKEIFILNSILYLEQVRFT